MNSMYNICDEYKKLIFEEYKELKPTIIFYGSSIYGVSSSDLDVCIICNDDCDKYIDDIISKTMAFHKKYNLKLDEEIPHKNKLIYKLSEIEFMLNFNPFFINGEYYISDIVKSDEFLSSKEMKTRLLLNILTTNHKTFGDNVLISKFEEKAWDIILDAIIGYNKMDTYDADSILKMLYVNQYTGSSGEMYLGYKKKYQKNEDYLKDKIVEFLERRQKND